MKTIIVTGSVGTGKTTLAKKLAKKLNYIYIDVSKLIKENNIIITQSTSAGFLAILSHKPTIYLNIHDFKDYEPYAKTRAALGVYSVPKLNQNIESLIKYPDLCAKNQTAFIKDFCYKLNGEASLRIATYIQTSMK